MTKKLFLIDTDTHAVVPREATTAVLKAMAQIGDEVYGYNMAIDAVIEKLKGK